MDLDEFIESLMKTERAPKFPLSMYYSEGVKYFNLRQYGKALEFLNNAVDSDPTNSKSLLKRSKCLIALRNYKEAIEDANKVLNLCPDSVEATDLKGQAQYLMGDFEEGCLTYLEGRKKKPVINAFRLGQQLCEDALDNSLHPSRGLKIKNADVASISKVQRNDKKFENRLKGRRSTQDCFRADKKFLEELMADKNLTSIHDFCKEGVDYVNDCERFWSMVTPLHSRMKKLKIIRRDVKKVPEAEKQLKICNAAKYRAESERKKGRIDDSIAEVGRMLNIIEYLPKQYEVEKKKFECDAHHLLSLAYKQGGNHSLAFQHLFKELELANESNLTIPQTRAYHQLGELYHIVGNYTKTLDCFYRIVTALSPEKIEELTAEGNSTEDFNCLQEAQEWANKVNSKIMMSLRESIIHPIVETIVQYSEEANSEDLDESNRENVQENRNS